MKTLVALLAFSLAMVAPLGALTVQEAQQAALKKYPALAEAGSPMNQRFLALVAEKRTSEPAFFARPDWPLRAADAVAAAMKAEVEKAKAAEKAAEAARLAALPPD